MRGSRRGSGRGIGCSSICHRGSGGSPITHEVTVYLRGSWRGGGFQCVASPHTSKLKS